MFENNNNNKNTGINCKVCGMHITPEAIKGSHYIAREDKAIGIAAALSSTTEPSLFDALDCPFCGCQNILRVRNRTVETQPVAEPEEDDEPEKMSDEDAREELNENWCCDCKHFVGGICNRTLGLHVKTCFDCIKDGEKPMHYEKRI